MKRLVKAHLGLHLWLAGTVFFICLFWLTRENKAWMNALTDYVTTPLKQSLGTLWALFPFSVMELLLVALVLGCVVWLVVCIVGTMRSGNKASFLYRCCLTLLCAGLSIYGGFCLLWGANYYTDGFQERAGIYAKEVAVEELAAVTKYFADRLTETAAEVVRDEKGCFAVPREEILAAGTSAYTVIVEEFPFLAFPDKQPKGIFFSPVMSLMGFTGVYSPFTGEANVNIDSPACMLPATIAHELAHQRSVASEQECNFLAILASTTCGDSAYAYSGWLLGYVHLGNALYSADKVRWQAVWDELPETVKADLQVNNVYWKQFEGITAQASQRVYDQFLKGYGESRGIQSYGTVVDLLVVYYQKFLTVPVL